MLNEETIFNPSKLLTKNKYMTDRNLEVRQNLLRALYLLNDPADCNDPGTQMNTMSTHMISETLFQTRISAFGHPNEVPAVYPGGDVDALVNDATVDCDCYVDFGNADMTRSDNGDILLTVNQGPHPSPNSHILFSIALFRGIQKMFQPDNYEFYKAKNGTVFTICFRTTSKGIPTHWDVSSIYP